MMRTSVSGLSAQASRLASVADNVANNSTVGYKRNAVEFQTQVLDTSISSYSSGSVNTTTRSEISRQGAIRSSTSPTDLAISGNGFFIVEDSADNHFLTRAGSFTIDNVGNLVNAIGNNLLGYDLTNTTTPPVANGFGGLAEINVGLVELSAVPTTQATLRPNLPADADIIAAGSLPSDNVLTSEPSGKTSLLMFDTLGIERTVDVYFAKTSANNWEVTAYDASASNNGGFPYSSAALSSTNLTFDPTTGLVTGGGPTTMSITIPNGAAATIDLTGITQLGADYTVISAETNGSAPAAIERVEINTDGKIFGIFQNGNAVPIFQLALAKVPSVDSLRSISGNNFGVTVDSGDVLVGLAESDGYGSILSGALEESNVDLATELTIMIEAQRSYTANSRVFQTGSDLMDVLTNL